MNETSFPVQIGRYVTVRLLGSGGMGEVYLSRDQQFDRLVAVKVLNVSAREDPELLSRFRREAECASRLSHPNLVKLYDYGEHDGAPFIVMQYVDGESLADLIKRRRRLEPLSALKTAREVLEALVVCHEAGILHRDVKPGNIIIDRSGRAHLVDLGLSKPLDKKTLTRTGSLVGTPRYVPPELLVGDRYDARSDVYQVGLVLYECLEGRSAFDGTDLAGLLRRITDDLPPPLTCPLSSATDWICELLARMLAKDAASRFQSSREVLDFLADESRRHQVAARKAPVPSSRPSSPPARPPISVRPMALALLVATLVAAATWTARRPGGGDAPRPSGASDMEGPSLRSSVPPSPPRARPPGPAPVGLAGPSPIPSYVARPISPEAVHVRVRQVNSLLTRIDDGDWPWRFQSEFRQTRQDAASRARLVARWKRLTADTFGSGPLGTALMALRDVIPVLPDTPELDPGDRALLLEKASHLVNLRRQLVDLFGGDWPVPAHLSDLPGLKVEPRPPAGVGQLLRVGMNPPRRFAQLEYSLVLDEDSRADQEFRLPPPLRIPRPLAEAYLGYRIGGSSSCCLEVCLSPDLRRPKSHLAAVIYGAGPKEPMEGYIRLDERLLDDHHAALVVMFESFAVSFFDQGLRVEWLSLLGRPGPPRRFPGGPEWMDR